MQFFQEGWQVSWTAGKLPTTQVQHLANGEEVYEEHMLTTEIHKDLLYCNNAKFRFGELSDDANKHLILDM
jgi:hypothetical protein